MDEEYMLQNQVVRMCVSGFGEPPSSLPRLTFLLSYYKHGQPVQVLDMGETALDQETFNDYLTEMRTHYTADKVRYFLCLCAG